MSTGGSVLLAMIIDFSSIDGTLVVAKPPEGLNADQIGAAASEIYETVLKAWRADYDKYADGKFNMLAAIRAELDKIGATVVTYEQEQYL